MTRKHLAIRMDKDEHKELKIMLAKKDLKFQEYVLDLIRKDINKKEK
ncbi:MAG: hypothetical protein ACRC7S_14100 [Cetobacterium sp.]